MKHLPKYQDRDWEVVDYQMYHDEEMDLSLRGPNLRPLEGSYAVCVGAAQTFGCFCEHPYPELLQKELDMPVVNLGYGGAGPRFFLDNDKVLELLNGAKFVVLQVMSGRSEDNSLFESAGLEYLRRRGDGEAMSADAAYSWLLEEYSPPKSLPAPLRKAARVFAAPKGLRRVIEETQENWVRNYLALMERIEVPVVLFWFSRRTPVFNRGERNLWWWWQRYDGVGPLFGEFPQLINRRMMRRLEASADHVVYCITRRGSPQKLFSRLTGEPVEVDHSRDRSDFGYKHAQNDYYPSPEMHEDAASTLLPVLRLLRDRIA